MNRSLPTLLIVGLGLLGASLGMALRGGSYRRLGWTRRPNIRRWAVDCDVLDECEDSLEEVLGKADLTDTVIKEIDNVLNARELVKVKIQESSLLDPKETANRLADMLGAEFVQAIGRKFVLYRESKDNKKIYLPK